MKQINFNLYNYGNAAANTDCRLGPAVLQKALKTAYFLQSAGWNTIEIPNSRHQQKRALSDVITLSTQLAQHTRDALQQHQFFITLGGDHTAAIGSWSGTATVLKNIGLIWFDAHMDSHTFETSHSNNLHGMPLATLLGHGESALTQLMTPNAKLKPENVVLIGIRSFEKGEAELLKKLNVKIFDMSDVKKLGVKKILHEAIDIVTKNTNGFGVSIDLDGFDPADAPGVGSPAPDGVHAAEFLSAFDLVAQHPKLIGADIAEFNPLLDVDHRTEKLAIALIEALTKS